MRKLVDGPSVHCGERCFLHPCIILLLSGCRIREPLDAFEFYTEVWARTFWSGLISYRCLQKNTPSKIQFSVALCNNDIRVRKSSLKKSFKNEIHESV